MDAVDTALGVDASDDTATLKVEHAGVGGDLEGSACRLTAAATSKGVHADSDGGLYGSKFRCPVTATSKGVRADLGGGLEGKTCRPEANDGGRPGPERGGPAAAEAAPASPSRRLAAAPPSKVVRRSRPVLVELFSGVATLTVAPGKVGFAVESWDIKLGPQ